MYIYQACEILWGLLRFLSLERVSPGASHLDSMAVVEVFDDELKSIFHLEEL